MDSLWLLKKIDLQKIFKDHLEGWTNQPHIGYSSRETPLTWTPDSEVLVVVLVHVIEVVHHSTPSSSNSDTKSKALYVHENTHCLKFNRWATNNLKTHHQCTIRKYSALLAHSILVLDTFDVCRAGSLIASDHTQHFSRFISLHLMIIRVEHQDGHDLNQLIKYELVCFPSESVPPYDCWPGRVSDTAMQLWITDEQPFFASVSLHFFIYRLRRVMRHHVTRNTILDTNPWHQPAVTITLMHHIIVITTK
jgi:hypothetical protein